MPNTLPQPRRGGINAAFAKSTRANHLLRWVDCDHKLFKRRIWIFDDCLHCFQLCAAGHPYQPRDKIRQAIFESSACCHYVRRLIKSKLRFDAPSLREGNVLLRFAEDQKGSEKLFFISHQSSFRDVQGILYGNSARRANLSAASRRGSIK